MFKLFSELISLSKLVSKKSLLVPLYDYDRKKGAEVKFLYLNERFSFKFELAGERKRTRTFIKNPFVCSTLSESTSTVHRLQHNSIIAEFLLDNGL